MKQNLIKFDLSFKHLSNCLELKVNKTITPFAQQFAPVVCGIFKLLIFFNRAINYSSIPGIGQIKTINNPGDNSNNNNNNNNDNNDFISSTSIHLMAILFTSLLCSIQTPSLWLYYSPHSCL